MPRSQVVVRGLAQVRFALSGLPQAFRDEAIPTIETGAAIIESEAKTRVPYDEGDLERSIETEIREDGLRATVGTDLFYGKFVELGTEDTPAQPYLYPAFRVGARYVRKQMRTWAKGAATRVRTRTKRPKK